MTLNDLFKDLNGLKTPTDKNTLQRRVFEADIKKLKKVENEEYFHNFNFETVAEFIKYNPN